ncbi:MAG: peptidase [Lachnospiraceae bacterium]|nr:peptidase [Lachnospiraceae bacterium]
MYRNSRRTDATRPRIVVLVVIFIIMAAILVQRLFTLQIIRGESYLTDFAMSIKKTRVLPSTRGEIYDTNGNLLAYNRLSYVVTFEDSGSYETRHERNLALNSILYRTIKMIEAHGDSIVKDFKIILNEEGEYVYNARGFTLSRFKADIFGQSYIDDLKPEQLDITAPDLMELLCSTSYYGIIDPKTTAKEKKDYGIPEEYTTEEILQLTALRSSLAANSYQRYNSIVIARDVAKETVSQLMENTDSLPGIDISEDYLRVYNHAEYFANIIGYTGKISADELKELRVENPDYDSSDIVGKVGIEKVMEVSLQGDKGSETIYVDNLGRTLSTESRIEPQAGNSLYLTLDTDLQIAAYKILEQYIAGILWQNIIDVEEVDSSWFASADEVKIPINDVYYALFENNVLDVRHLSDKNASANEKTCYQEFLTKSDSIFAELKKQLTTSAPIPYKDLREEMQVYQSYIVNTMLQETGILNTDAIDESDLTWRAWSEEETISLQEFLTYAISKNWIDMNGVVENTSYLDSDEIYSALADYIQSYLFEDTDFTKRVFRYMLKEGSMTGEQVCMLLFDQGVLEMNEEDYNNLATGSYGAYYFILDKIYNLEITPAQLALRPCSGAIVITDPKTGDVKACVSYPSYDNNRLVNDMDTEYYNNMVTDLSSPFYSRATQEVLAPGSTFKLVTATAGVMEEQIGLDEGIYCTGLFTDVSPEIKCWVNPGMHGTETLSTAIRDSCNFFFNTVGFRLASVSGEYDDDTGVKTLQKYAAMYGLDSPSGVEVPETSPHMATYSAAAAAMGQSNHAYTVTQIARYVSTIANSGTCYDLTLIDRITDSNGNTIDEHQPNIHSTVDIPDSLWYAIHSGMRAMIQQHKVFKDYNGVAVAGKTGTAQETTDRPNHALFIGYAPYTDPEMAITVRVANGYTSSNSASIAKDVISYYFETSPEAELITGHAMQVTADNSTTD